MAYGVWEIAGYDRAEGVRICRSGISPLLAVLLASRGVGDDEIKRLTGRECDPLTDPLAMADMERAAARVRMAIDRGEHVAVYGDYDVDGITSSCLVAEYLRSKGLRCDIYIPDRLEEGYGVNAEALDTIASAGATLIITVDCGVTAVKEAELAKKLGVDMVITDHHEVSCELPDTIVVDPKRADCPSQAKGLAGVGVAFKLICAVEGPEQQMRLLDDYGDLVAIGTIADVMPVTGENRTLIRRGLDVVRSGRRPGLRELCSAAGLDLQRLSVSGVGYGVAPRINAAGRLGDTGVSVRLLTTRDDAEAAKLADELCRMNTRRRNLEAEMLEDAFAQLGKDAGNGRPIVLSSEKWHQGVAGIVSSRIAEKFGVPTVMICVKDGVGRGSCRSTGNFSIHAALEKCKDHLISFGGHDMAAGLTMRADEIDAFREKLARCYEEHPGDCSESVLKVDFEIIKPEILSARNIEDLDRIDPYGVGNPQPVMCLRDVRVESVMPLSDGKHTKMYVRKGGTVFEALFFSRRADELGAKEGVTADIAFSPQVNEFRGRRNVQLCLVDFVLKS